MQWLSVCFCVTSVDCVTVGLFVFVRITTVIVIVIMFASEILIPTLSECRPVCLCVTRLSVDCV